MLDSYTSGLPFHLLLPIAFSGERSSSVDVLLSSPSSPAVFAPQVFPDWAAPVVAYNGFSTMSLGGARHCFPLQGCGISRDVAVKRTTAFREEM